MKEIFKLLGYTVGGVAIVVTLLYFTVIDFWTIPSDDPALVASMAPTLAGGDFVVIAKDAIPEVPELVRCVDPDDPEKFVVARVIAKNTEPITIIGDVANSKGRREPSPRRCEPAEVEVTTKEGTKRSLECWEENYAKSSFRVLRGGANSSADFDGKSDPGKLFLVSDNRTVHLDSRDYGQVEPRFCRRIYVRLWGAGGILEPHFQWVF